MNKEIIIGNQDKMRSHAFDLIESESGMILEIGCGTGNFAQNFYIEDYKHRYVGIDKNPEKILAAKTRFPELSFETIDMMRSDFAQMSYLWDAQTIYSFQTLEHIGAVNGYEDICLLSRARPGTEIILSVPNYKSKDHKRWFTLKEWLERYDSVIKIDQIFIYHRKGYPKKRCFLMHARRRDD